MKPMLAATIEDIKDLDGRYPLLASPKLDGIRAVTHKGKILSRNLKPIPNRHIQNVLALLPSGLDGELIVGEPTSKTCFRDTSSGVMSVEGEPTFSFYIFDICHEENNTEAFSERYKKLQIYAKGNRLVKLVPQKRIKDSFELYEYEKEMLERGFEGVMLRIPMGLYKEGRSTLREGHLMKMKRFMDGEAKVLKIVELQHNENELTEDELGRAKRSSHKAGKVGGETMGSLHVKDLDSGVEFDIGAGFTAEERQDIWNDKRSYLNKVIKYKFFPQGSKDKPRFPVFLGFRHKQDL